MQLFSIRNSIILATSLLLGALFNAPLLAYKSLSTDGEFVASTLLEIAALRIILLVLGVLVLVSLGAWVKLRGHRWQAALKADFNTFLTQNSGSTKRNKGFERGWSIGLLITFAALLVTIHLSFDYADDEWYKNLTAESGFWETLTAVYLVVGGGLLLRTGLAFRHQGSTLLSWGAPALLGLLFCVMAGEEISWGQHWIGFATPEALVEVNVQNEFNFHNIGSYWANQLVMLFFFAYIGIVPILDYLFVDIQYLTLRLHLPLVPLAVAPYGFINLVLGDQQIFQNLWGMPLYRLSEAREALLGAIVLGLGINTWLAWRRASILTTSHATDSRTLSLELAQDNGLATARRTTELPRQPKKKKVFLG